MGKVKWTRQAVHCLEGIHSSIADYHPAAARRTIDKIRERAQMLAEFPELGYRHPNPENKPIRVLGGDRYQIAYLVKDGGGVDILVVFHNRMDLSRYFK